MRKIIHIDMDYFYAQVEEREDPSLKSIPVAVGGDKDRRGVVCTSNYIARQYGVRSAMSTQQALIKCPNLRVIEPNFTLYREVSNQIRNIFLSYTPLIEPLSLDEAYLDVTGLPFCQGSATWMAQSIRKDIYEQTQLTASAGIAPNKFLAKVASDWQKPNGQFTIPPKAVASFVKALPVKKIFGVGPVMARKLHELNIYTCEDLQHLSLDECIRRYGKIGAALFERARGQDDRVVNNQRIRKSLSVEETYPADLLDLETCMGELRTIYEKLLARLEQVGDRNISALFIKVKFHDFTNTTVEHVGNDLNLACFQALLKEGFKRGQKAVRLLGIGVKFTDREEPEFEQLLLL